jgi:hypothetical protein
MRMGADDDPQVGRDGRLLRDDVHAALVELALELVDLAVGRDDLLRAVVVGLEQRGAGSGDRCLDEAAHLDQAFADVLQLGLEDLSHRVPLRGVFPPRLSRVAGPCADVKVNRTLALGEQSATGL